MIQRQTDMGTNVALDLPPGSLIAQVGGTPLLRLDKALGRLAEGVEVWAKAEWHNASGSARISSVTIIRTPITRRPLRTSTTSGPLPGSPT